jgi:hypothetical protein
MEKSWRIGATSILCPKISLKGGVLGMAGKETQLRENPLSKE